MLALLLPFALHGQQAPKPITPRPAPVVILPTPSAVQFQQAAQQQLLRDQIQKSQLQSQLQQSVSTTAKGALPVDAPMRQQIDQSDAARQDRQRAVQQDLLDRSLRIEPPPVYHLEPARSRSGR